MHVTIIKTGSASLNVLVIYRRLTELMITPVRERRDAFINTAGFHREIPCVFRNIPKKERRNISPFLFFIILFFFFSFFLFLRIKRARMLFFFFEHDTTRLKVRNYEKLILSMHKLNH